MKFKSLDELRKTKVGQRPENIGVLGALQTQKPKPNQRSEGQDPKLETRQRSVAFSISLIVVSRRLMDEHDNLRSACKPMVDAITNSLGFRSDDDTNLTWHYHQIKGMPEGVIVKIDQL